MSSPNSQFSNHTNDTKSENKRKRQKKNESDSQSGEPSVKVDRRKTRPVHPRVTGVDKIKTRMTNLETILNSSVPKILQLLNQVQQQEDSGNDTEDTIINTSSSLDFNSDSTDVDMLLNLLTPPKARFTEHDFSHHLINLFFTINEYTGECPIVTRLEFFNNPLVNPFPKLLTYAMLAFSSRYSNHSQLQYQNTEYSDHYIKSVNSELIRESFSPSVTSIQGLLILCSLDLMRGNLYNTWNWLGQAIRLAQQLNFHELNNTDVDYFQFHSNEDKAKFQRLWNLCQLFEMELCQLLGKPSMIKDYSISSTSAQALNLNVSFFQDDYITKCIGGLPVYARNSLQYMKELNQFSKNVEQMTQTLSFNSNSNWVLQQYYNLNSQLSSWYHKLPSILSYRKEFQSEPLRKKFPFLEQIIHGHLIYNRTQLTLLKPVLENFDLFKTNSKSYEMILKGIENCELVGTYLSDWLMVKDKSDNFESALDQFELQGFPFTEEFDNQNFSAYSSSPSFPSFSSFSHRPATFQSMKPSTVPFISAFSLTPGLIYILILKAIRSLRANPPNQQHLAPSARLQLNQLILMENLVDSKFQYFLNCIQLVEKDWEGSSRCHQQLMHLYTQLNSSHI